MISTTNSKETYPGDGGTTVFSITFPFLSNDHVSVIVADAMGIEAVLPISDYSIVGTTVYTVTPPPAGGYIRLERNTPILQPNDYLETGAFPAEAHESILDRLTMICQELYSKVTTTLVSSGVSAGSFSYESIQTLSSGGTIVASAEPRSIMPVVSIGGPASSIVLGTGAMAGQELVIIGQDDVNSIELISSGMQVLNGDITLKLDDTLTVIWNGSKWIETARSV